MATRSISISGFASTRPGLFPVAALLVAMVSIQYGATLAHGLFIAVGAEGTTGLRLGVAALMLALTRMPARVYGTLTSLEPAIGAMMGLLLLHQRITTLQWAGIAVIVAAALGAATSMKPAISPE